MVNGIKAPLLGTSAPGWLSATIVVVAITLAVATVALMLARPRATDTGEAGAGRRVVDPLLILSALVVIALAVAAWLLR